MDGSEHSSTEERLVAHVEWVRTLARRLAGDAESAEDLAQDALVVALRTGPRASLKFRPWMAAVMRNLVRQGARGESRREDREERAARPESGDRLVDEVVAGRELAQAVLDLDEPYRTALLLRFFEGAPPREIARRLDVPVATVNSRIARGLARLRERYDAEPGRDGRLAAFAALLEPTHTAAQTVLPALSIGGLVLNAKLVISAAALALLAAAYWGISTTKGAESESANELARASASPLASRAAPLDELRPVDGPESSREALAEESRDSPAKTAPPAAPLEEVTGVLLDAEGLPLAGLAVGSGATTARTNGAGRFALTTRADTLALAVSDPGWVTVREGAWRAGSSIEPAVVAARAVSIGGEVVDVHGTPIQDARVELQLPDDFMTRFGINLESSRPRAFGATTDERGRFDLATLPVVAGARIRALREGWLKAEVELPGLDDSALRIVMNRPQIPLSGALQGTVVDDRGDPVPEARVFLGLASTTTDSRGRFGIELARAVTSDRIVAVKPGRLPAFLDRPRDSTDEDTGWPSDVVLVIGSAPLSIRGVVLGDDGKPRADVRVSIADPTAIGTIGRMPTTAEGLASGAKIPPEAIEPDGRAPKQGDESIYSNTSNVGPSSAFWNYVTTDTEGRFEIGGLSDRRYRLKLREPRSLTTITTDPISAGETSAKVRLPAPNVWAELHGQVVDDEGRPIEGVEVTVWSEAYGVRARIYGGETRVSLRDEGAQVLTGKNGSFVLRDVPREGSVLQIESQRTTPLEVALGAETDPANVEIELAMRCSFELRVLPGADIAPTEFAMRDARGEPIHILRIEPNSTTASSQAALSGGRSGVLSASSAARTLVLMRDGVELRRVPIRLRADELNAIDI